MLSVPETTMPSGSSSLDWQVVTVSTWKHGMVPSFVGSPRTSSLSWSQSLHATLPINGTHPSSLPCARAVDHGRRRASESQKDHAWTDSDCVVYEPDWRR